MSDVVSGQNRADESLLSGGFKKEEMILYNLYET